MTVKSVTKQGGTMKTRSIKDLDSEIEKRKKLIALIYQPILKRKMQVLFRKDLLRLREYLVKNYSPSRLPTRFS